MWKNRILHHRSPMQTEKSQPEGQRIMPKTRLTELKRLTEFPALSVNPKVGISRSALETSVL